MGAFTVTGCKGLGIGLKEIFNREFTYSKWLTFSCAIMIFFCVLVQMIYLNRALDLFSTPIVTTVYYVYFTTCVLITSGILFHEWEKLTLMDIMACLIGFLITTCGLILINCLKINLQSSQFCFLCMINDQFSSCYLDDSFLQYFPSNSTSAINTKQQQHYIQVKSYANLLVDDDNLSSITNSHNVQRQPMLLIDEHDLNS
jgi:hypothetical protein